MAPRFAQVAARGGPFGTKWVGATHPVCRVGVAQSMTMDDHTPQESAPEPAEESVGPLRTRPAWYVPTRVSALAGYATTMGMAAAAASLTCTVISANPL